MYRMLQSLRTWFQQKPAVSRQAPRSRWLSIEALEDRVTPTGNLQSILGLNQIEATYPTLTGTGYTVAVLDTGINYNLPSLGGGIGTGHRVIYGYNFVNNTTNALDDNGHGTYLANEIGSSDSTNPGVAPNVQFADLKVLDSNMNGNWTSIDNALKWVVANQAKDHIVAVNMSLGSGNYTSDSYSVVETELSELKSLGVFVAVASGNNYATNNSNPGLAYPAVDPDVVSVGATWTGNFGAQTFDGATDYTTANHQLASFTQRDSALSILAPGAWITGIGINGTTTMGGTSMATAVVTGAAALLHQALDQTGQSSLTSEQNILQLMQSTGTTVVDNNAATNVTPTGLTFKELNLAAALNKVILTAAPPVLSPISNVTQSHGQSAVVTLNATDPGGRPLTFSAQVLSTSGQTPPLTISVQANHLVITPQQAVLGAFTIQVMVSDGLTTASRTFVLTLTNTAPTVAPIASQSLAKGQTTLTLPINASDADNDALTFQAVAMTPGSLAYQLEQKFGFVEYGGSYMTNIQGAHEEWLVDKTGMWYALLPTGQLYRWSQTMTQTLKPANLIATFDPSFYANPELLWNAQPPVTPAITFSFQGNQLIIQRPANLTGVFNITVSVSDAWTTTQQTFQLTLN